MPCIEHSGDGSKANITRARIVVSMASVPQIVGHREAMGSGWRAVISTNCSSSSRSEQCRRTELFRLTACCTRSMHLLSATPLCCDTIPTAAKDRCKSGITDNRSRSPSPSMPMPIASSSETDARASSTPPPCPLRVSNSPVFPKKGSSDVSKAFWPQSTPLLQGNRTGGVIRFCSRQRNRSPAWPSHRDAWNWSRYRRKRQRKDHHHTQNPVDTAHRALSCGLHHSLHWQRDGYLQEYRLGIRALYRAQPCRSLSATAPRSHAAGDRSSLPSNRCH